MKNCKFFFLASLIWISEQSPLMSLPACPCHSTVSFLLHTSILPLFAGQERIKIWKELEWWSESIDRSWLADPDVQCNFDLDHKSDFVTSFSQEGDRERRLLMLQYFSKISIILMVQLWFFSGTSSPAAKTLFGAIIFASGGQCERNDFSKPEKGVKI